MVRLRLHIYIYFFVFLSHQFNSNTHKHTRSNHHGKSCAPVIFLPILFLLRFFPHWAWASAPRVFLSFFLSSHFFYLTTKCWSIGLSVVVSICWMVAHVKHVKMFMKIIQIIGRNSFSLPTRSVCAFAQCSNKKYFVEDEAKTKRITHIKIDGTVSRINAQ